MQWKLTHLLNNTGLGGSIVGALYINEPANMSANFVSVNKEHENIQKVNSIDINIKDNLTLLGITPSLTGPNQEQHLFYDIYLGELVTEVKL